MDKRPPDRSGRRARSLGGSSTNSGRRSGSELEPKRHHRSMDETKGTGASLRLEANDAQVRETMTAAIEFSADGFLQQINEYECIRDLGFGAMTEVKLCRRLDKHTGEEELVAVKVFNKSVLNKQARKTAFRQRKKHAKEDSQPLQNVRREVALMKKLVHPNVVRLLEVIDDPHNDLLFVAMEYVHNGAVMVWDDETRQYVSPATGGVLPPKTAAAYFRGILDGLEFLHANHVVHRDLKPENVLLNKDGVAKIADFGVAHIFDDPEDMVQPNGGNGNLSSEEMRRHRYQLTQPEGTWSFWAPEVCSSSNAAGQRFMEAVRRRGQKNKATPGTVNERALVESDRRRSTAKHSLRRQGTYDAFAADVWAAGVCLWVFRFGTPPFYDPDPANLFLDICEKHLRFPDEVSEGDEEVLQQEANEKKRAANRAAAKARAAAKEAAEAAEVAKEVALAEGQEASNWLTGEAGEEMGSAAQDFAESSRGMQIVIPEEGEFDDDTDLQSPGQLPALGSGRRSHREGAKEKRKNEVTSAMASSPSPAPAPANAPSSALKPKITGPLVVARAAEVVREWGADVSAAFDAWSTPPRKAREVKAPPEPGWLRRPRSGGSRRSLDRDRDNRDRGGTFSGQVGSAGRQQHQREHMSDCRDRDGGAGGRRRHNSQIILPPTAARLAAASVAAAPAAAPASRARVAKACYVRSASSPVMMHDDMFSSSEIPGTAMPGSAVGGDVGVGGMGGDGRKHSGTLRDLLTALLKKNVSERITVREAQEHPWMTRMCPRKEDGSGGGEDAGQRRRAPPPVKKVSVTAGEVKGAIVHINSLFVIAVKSRLTQRLARARNNIARRRLQATTGEKYGPSLSDTEQEHLRKVRDLTEALTKDESALVNHDLANEPERSLSDSDLPSATCSGAWQATVMAQRKQRGVYSRVAKRLYTRSASRAAKRDNIHHAINKYLGNPDGSGGGRKSSYKGHHYSYDGRRRGSRERSIGHHRSRSGGHKPRSSSGHRQSLQAAPPKKIPPIGGAAGLSGLTSIPKSLANQIPGPTDSRQRHPAITLVAPPNLPPDFSPNPPPPPRPRASEALRELEIPDEALVRRVYEKARSSEAERSSTERSVQTLASKKVFESPTDSDSGSLSSDFSKSDRKFSYVGGVSDAGDNDSSSGVERSGTLTSFGSDASSRSANSHRSRGSFSVFGIKRHTLKMKISRMSMLVKRGSSGSGSAGDEKDKDRDDGAGVRSMMMAPPPLRGFKKNEKAKASTLGRLSGVVLGEKKQRRAALNGNFPSNETKDVATGTRGYVSMGSMASTSSVGASSEAEGGRSIASDASTDFRTKREVRAVSPLTTGVSTLPNRPPSGGRGTEAARGNHRRPQADMESPWGPRGSKEIVGTRSVRRSNELLRKKENCDMS